jgi:hypothetical protein
MEESRGWEDEPLRLVLATKTNHKTDANTPNKRIACKHVCSHGQSSAR